MKKLFSLAVGVMASAGTAVWAAPPQARPTAPASVTAAAEALTRGETLEALTRADEALRADPANAWAHYNRAAALAGLNRVDEALTAYDTAAARFATSDKRGRSLALWGKAHLLYRTGRCQEASQAFGEYTKFVGSSDPQATQLAAHRASTCRPGAANEATASAGAPAPETASSKGSVKVEPGTEVKPASSMPSLAKP